MKNPTERASTKKPHELKGVRTLLHFRPARVCSLGLLPVVHAFALNPLSEVNAPSRTIVLGLSKAEVNKVRRMSSSPSMTAEDEVKMQFTKSLKTMGKAALSGDQSIIQSWIDEYTAGGNSLKIRPSGNPMTLNDAKAMWSSTDVSFTALENVSIDSVRIFAGGKAAVVMYTNHDIFEYKGEKNDVYSSNTAVLEKRGDTWKLLHWHRCGGVPTITWH